MNDSKRLEKGQVHFRTIIEVAGRPKEYVEETIKNYVKKIKKEEKTDIVKEEYSDVKKQEDEKTKEEFWHKFVELELWSKNLPSLIDFCFDYMPSSIEVIGPKELHLREREISGLLNDLQGNLHRMNMMVKEISTANLHLKQNAHNLLWNMIAVLTFKQGKTLEQLSKITGFAPDNLQNFLDKLVKDEKLIKERDKYFLKNGSK
jgi:hypothetical protein